MALKYNKEGWHSIITKKGGTQFGDKLIFYRECTRESILLFHSPFTITIKGIQPDACLHNGIPESIQCIQCNDIPDSIQCSVI